MKVFISWSGERSLHIAKALHEWIPLVLQSAEPWVSQESIEAGERWGQAVASELGKSDFGIICVTPENVREPWILFEAGALAKSLDTARVIPLLHDLELRELQGPLSQFQGKRLDEPHMLDVIRAMNSKCQQPIDMTRLEKTFKAHWGDFASEIRLTPAHKAVSLNVRPTNDILEELVERIRSMQNMLTEENIKQNISPSPQWTFVQTEGYADISELERICSEVKARFPGQTIGYTTESNELALRPPLADGAVEFVRGAVKNLRRQGMPKKPT